MYVIDVKFFVKNHIPARNLIEVRWYRQVGSFKTKLYMTFWCHEYTVTDAAAAAFPDYTSTILADKAFVLLCTK